MIIIIAIILPVLFIIFNVILFNHIIYKSNRNILFINLCIFISLFFLNIFISIEYLILILFFVLTFILFVYSSEII